MGRCSVVSPRSCTAWASSSPPVHNDTKPKQCEWVEHMPPLAGYHRTAVSLWWIIYEQRLNINQRLTNLFVPCSSRIGPCVSGYVGLEFISLQVQRAEPISQEGCCYVILFRGSV